MAENGIAALEWPTPVSRRSLVSPRTLLIDSRQIEAGDAFDKGFRNVAGPEIEQFKRELAAREAPAACGAN